MSQEHPTSASHRIQELDLLRGFALLGILLMNIISFGHIGTAYVNPTLGPGIEGVNGYLHGFAYLFADMRFMGMFSILFGAGIALFSERAEDKHWSPKRLHYKRMLWLFVFGMVHAYFIWYGDILVTYAICGSLVFLVRRWRTKRLYVLATILFLIPVILSALTYFGTPEAQLQEIFGWWNPSKEKLTNEVETMRSGYLTQMPFRSAAALEMQTFLLLWEHLWRASAMMILGMLFYRGGIVTGKRSKGFYQRCIFLGGGIGLGLSAIGLYTSYESGWDGVWVMNLGHSFNYLASVPMVIAYIGFIVLWGRTHFLQNIQNRLRAVGRTAFTAYILTSVICTLIFNGHGLGLFGYMDRTELYLVTLGVWIILLLHSTWILNSRKQGPLERLWRRLTYGWSS